MELVEFEAPERKSFRVDDDASAAWAMRKLHSARRVIAERTAEAVAEQERVERWLAEVTKSAQADVVFFESLLADYARRRRVEDGTKTLVLPHGKVATRQKQAGWMFDESAFVPWAKEHAPGLLRVKMSVDAAAAKKALTWTGETAVTADGESVPGVAVTVPAGDDYTVTVSVTDD